MVGRSVLVSVSPLAKVHRWLGDWHASRCRPIGTVANGGIADLECVRSGRLPSPSSLPPAASILTVHPMRRPVLLRMISLDHHLQYADALPQRPRDWSLKDLSRVRMPT